MPIIIDMAEDATPHLNALKNAGVKTIIRYINPLGTAGEKTVKIAEARAIAKTGLRLALVCEGYGGTQGRGIDGSSGVHDGTFCRDYAKLVGALDGAAIYFAVDIDATPNFIKYNVLPYFAEIKKQFYLCKFRIGVYGSGNTCRAVKNAGLAELFWLSCSYGWGGFSEFLNSMDWNLRQHCDTNVGGTNSDSDDPHIINGVTKDIGDFVPWELTTAPNPPSNPPLPFDPPIVASVLPPATPQQITKWLQQSLNKLGASLDVDGEIGPLSLSAVAKYLT